MKKKMLFVFNPLSGRAQIKNSLLGILDIFTKADFEVTAYPTQARLDCYNIIKENGPFYDIAVCCGGDGTLNETVKGLMELVSPPVLGYIPAGTTNDFAFSLKLPKDMKKAAEVIVSGVPFSCDIGTFNGNYFTYVSAFGAFTDVSYQTPQQTKNVLGHLAYVLEGIKRFPTIKSYQLKVEHDGKIVEDVFILGLITNSVSIGGYTNLSELGILLDDGLFEVTLIRTPKGPFDVQNILTSIIKQNLSSPYIYSVKTSAVKISCEEPVSWTLDGENGDAHTEAVITNHKQAINILIPRSELPRLP
ncbi:MAG: YegS/Rv2252/BmrU family lipid kinase [Oscillospiraceae bacterium]|jgi:YegS/Rv2252/BmrU family lipid kinase